MTLDENEKNLLSSLKIVAKKRVKEGKQFSEFTGLIGELTVCELQDYEWKPSEGYDAIKDGKKIQIKARRLQSSRNLKGGTLGRFGSAKKIKDDQGKDNEDKYDFDRGILVVLDKEFEIAAIWERDKCEIQCLENEDKEKVRKRKSDKLPGLTVRKFIENKCHSHAKNKSNGHTIKEKCDKNFDCLTKEYGWK